MKYLSALLYLLCFQSIANDLKIFAVDEPPASFINEDGAQDGYVIDIIKAIQERLNDKTNIIFLPEGRALNILAKDPNSILMSISRTPPREQHYYWIAQVMSKKWQVYTLTNSEIVIETLDDLRALPSIGVVRGDVREEWLINKGFENLNSVTRHKQNIEKLNLSRVNAIVYEKQGLAYQVNNLGLELSHFKSAFILNEAPVYIVMSIKSSKQQVKKWQNAFEAIKVNGKLQNIAQNWQLVLLQQYNISSEIKNNILVF
ncbi:substrate-binding periplasmic protein [Paraglaciecola arctica]|uniref:Solute-binding protein family 3/N-terminal domain-containing protein n=1 Tax=Paraglaciecola arctica BSs20135 TaxID=493475 RepID=K6ZC53_9ALTE|nr:transporter substrate-binding domain-containing protein [Paraglaciecola arctica]GAC21015.1 hypothetical protein GARC_4068 [Paraglaciecola arctica BSs20135]